MPRPTAFTRHDRRTSNGADRTKSANRRGKGAQAPSARANDASGAEAKTDPKATGMVARVDETGRGRDNPDVNVALQELLASTFQCYRDLHLAHFNVTGPSFPQLHVLFEQQYQEVWAAVDEVAERIRAVGVMVSARAFDPDPVRIPNDAGGMVGYLAQAHREVAGRCNALVKAAEAVGDEASVDLGVERLRAHQKHAWMCEATLQA